MIEWRSPSAMVLGWRQGLEAAILVGVLFSLAGMAAAEVVRERDTNRDGSIDQIARYSKTGSIEALEMDSDHDGRMDRFQYYTEGKIVRLDADSDDDGEIDSRDLFVDGKRTRHLRLIQPGEHIVEIIEFDEQQLPLLIKKDTTINGGFDTIFHFSTGRISSSIRDLDGDGHPETRTAYHNDLPRKQWNDRDSDGNVESILSYNEKGSLRRSFHDTDQDGYFEETRKYQDGEIALQQKDLDGNEVFEIITTFINGEVEEQRRDSNDDGVFDIITRFQNGLPRTQEKDTDFDGKNDWFCDFDKYGEPLRIREDADADTIPERVRLFKNGKPEKICDDPDEDGVYEIVTILANGLQVSQKRDSNNNGDMDITVYFDAREKRERTLIDSDHNGNVDTWEFFEDDEIVLVEQDPGEKGWVQYRLHYLKGRKIRMEHDSDGDGHFEMREFFNDPHWSSVVEWDENGDSHPEERICSQDGVIRLKEVDHDGDGHIDMREEYDAEGIIEKLLEDDDGDHRLELVWHYTAGEPVLAEKDSDGDGRVDIRYHYLQGRVTRVEEDSNGDGFVDLFEYYDTAGILVEKARDLDNDGLPDIREHL